MTKTASYRQLAIMSRTINNLVVYFCAIGWLIAQKTIFWRNKFWWTYRSHKPIVVSSILTSPTIMHRVVEVGIEELSLSELRVIFLPYLTQHAGSSPAPVLHDKILRLGSSIMFPPAQPIGSFIPPMDDPIGCFCGSQGQIIQHRSTLLYKINGGKNGYKNGYA